MRGSIVYIDTLKAKTAVQNSEFRRDETAESRMAGRYTHRNCDLEKYQCSVHL